MLQGAGEVSGPLWGWDGDGEDDWGGAVLTLLALAAVATIALTLQWFGSRQDQEADRSAPTPAGVQRVEAEGNTLALHPKSKDSDASEGQSKGREKSEAPGDGHRRPATARAQDSEPSRGRSAESDAWLSLKTPGEVASRGIIPATMGKKRREPPRPETSFQGHSKARDIPVPITIRFTPRSPDCQTEMQVVAAGTCGKGAAQQDPVHTEQQETSPWHLAVGTPGPLGRSLGSLRRRRRPGARSGDRPCRPLKLDPLRLGTVVSVWDAVDLATAATQDIFTSSSLAGPSPHHSRRGFKGPEEMGLADAVESRPRVDSGDVCGRSGPQLAPVSIAGSGAKDGENREPGSPAPRETQGILTDEEAWSRESGAAVVTSNFTSSQGPLPEELHPEACEEDQVADQSRMEKSGDGHLNSQGRGSRQGKESEQIAGGSDAGQRAVLISDKTKSAGGFSCTPSHNLPASPLTRNTELVPSSATAVHRSPGFPHAVSTFAPLNSLSLEVNQGGENLRAGPASLPTQTLASAGAPTSAPEAILSPSSISPPTFTSAPSLTPAPVKALSSISTPTPSLTSSPTPSPTPVTALTLNSTPTSSPTAASALVEAQVSAVDSELRPMSQESSVGLSKRSLDGRISASWGNLIAMVLRSHPFPRQEKADGSAPRADLQSPAQPNTSAYLGGRQPGTVASAGALSSLQDKHRPPSILVTPVGSGGQAEGRCETQPMSVDTSVSSTRDPRGDETKEESQESRAPAAKPEAVPEFPASAQPGLVPSTMKQEAQPIPQPRRRKRSLAQSSEQILTQEVSQKPTGQGLKEGTRPSGSRDVLTEKQKETQKLMIFLQKPGSWGVVEGSQKSRSQASQPTTALWPPKLDLGSCLEVLAFAQQHGELGLAQDTYVLMSNNLLHVLGDPHLYRQLSGADRERILNLRTCQGQTVLGVLELPSLYQVSRSGLTRGPPGAAVMRYNTVTGSWSRAASLPLPDPAPLHCTVLGNTIYCLNHQVTATFTVSEGTAQFQAKELQPFPLGSKGVLYPFTLTLPPKTWLQTTI
ncbi:hypothetical protein ACRRTK_023806 [Alexandromys fortis]